MIQLGAVKFFSEGSVVAPKNARNPGGDNPDGEDPRKVLCDVRRGKWLDRRFGQSGSELVIELQHATSVDSYELWTANDAPSRDPMKWTLHGASSASGPWDLLDTQELDDAPGDRY